MGAKEELDERIKAKIKPNGEGQINGQMMQNTLLDVNATNQKMYHPRGGDKLLDFLAKGITAIKGVFENLVAKQADIDCITTPEIVSPGYTDGALGQGLRYYVDDNGNSVLILDKLRVMKEATFNILTVSELRSVGGQILLTYADAQLVAVQEKPQTWRCYYDSGDGGQYWVIGDQARCQKFTGSSGDTLKYYWRLVTAVGNEELGGKMLQWIELSKEVVDGDGVPEVGDECVGLGHRGEDRRRKNAKLISAFGEKGVEEISYANIDSFSLVGKETAYQSPEKWRVSSKAFELVADNGVVYPTVVERGAWSLTDAPYYYYDRVSHGGNIYLCINQGLEGTNVEPATDQHAVWLCEVRKGDDGAKGDKGDQGERGAQGLQGLQGAKGDQGIAGAKGADGVSSYFHIKYSPVPNPTAAQMTETPSTYIGTYTDSVATDSVDPLKYKWARFEGLQGPTGERGIPGVGQDGKTSYLHIKYSNDAGKTFTASNGETPGTWIGQCTDFNQNDPSTVGAYVWSKIKGETGDKGDTGASAPRLRTQFSANGTTAWHDAYAAGDAYRRESNDNGATWSVAMKMVGEKGEAGANGTDGKKTPYTDFAYAYGLSQPTTWLDAPPTKVEGQHLWERIQKYAPKSDNSGWTLSSTSYAIINEFVQISGVNLLQLSKYDNVSRFIPNINWAVTIVEDSKFGKVVQCERINELGSFQTHHIINTEELFGQDVVYMLIAKQVSLGGSWCFGGWNQTTASLTNNKYTIDLGGGWRLYWSTFKFPNTHLVDSFGINSIMGTWQFAAAMVCRGNKPMISWSPAPEDVQAEIDKANAALADMANDGKLTPTEKQQTVVEWSRIKAEHAKNTAAATAAGVSTDEVKSAYNTLSGYLETGANPLLKDLTTTSDIVGSTFRSTFATWYDKNATLVNATAQAVARNAVDAVQIGGTNLLNGTKNKTGTSNNAWEFLYTFLSSDIVPGVYTLSLKNNSDKPIKALISIRRPMGEDRFSANIQKGERGAVTTRIEGQYTDVYIGLHSADYSAIGVFDVSDIKLEKGNKATDWSPSPDDLQTEIDNIRIGGVNLITNSAKISSTANSVGNAALPSGVKITTKLLAGHEYIATIESRGESTNNNIIIYPSDQWVQFGEAFTPTQDVSFMTLRGTPGSPVSVTKLKLEKGNKATDWSPAPEDVQAEIDKANAALADMANDGKLTPTEKQQTAVEWSRIKAEQAKNTAAATAAGVSTAEVTIAYNTLNGYLETGANPLLKNLTTTSDIVGSTFRSTFATWYDKNATLVNATAEAVARNAADAVQIGGVNLLRESGTGVGWQMTSMPEPKTFASTAASLDETAYIYSPYVTLKGGVLITLSFESKEDDTINSRDLFIIPDNFNVYGFLYATFPKNLTWRKNTHTFITPAEWGDGIAVRLRIDHNGSTDGALATIYARNIKLEYGNKATDWSPAPEDVQAEIDKANAVLADMANDNKLTPTEKQQTAVEWSRIKAEQAKNTAAATAAGVSTAEVTIAYNTLNGYLETGANPLLKDLTTTSDIVGSTFRNTFATWYDKNAALVNATAEAVARNAVDAVQIGGVNLALNSKLNLSSNSYEIATVSLSEGLRDGQQVTITINGVLPEGKKYYIGTSPSSRQFITLSKADNEIYTGTGVFSISPSYPNDVRNKLMLFCYPEPGDLASKTDTVMVEKGNKRSDWSPAPQDVQAEIDKATSVVYSIKPSAEQIRKIVTTDAKGIRRVELLPSLVSVTATIKRGNRDESVISSAPMGIYASNWSSITVQQGQIDLNSEELYDEVREWWEWFDVILYSDTTYSKELARKRIHINENADISGAEIVARVNYSGSEVQIEGEKISVIGKMIQLNKMTVDVNGNATMNNVTMNNAIVSGNVTANSGNLSNMLVVSNNQLRSGNGLVNILNNKTDATKPGLVRCDTLSGGRLSVNAVVVAGKPPILSKQINLTNQTAGKFQFAAAVQLRPTSGGPYTGMVALGLYINGDFKGTIASGLQINGSLISNYFNVNYTLDSLSAKVQISIQFQYAFNGTADIYFNQSNSSASPIGIWYENTDKNIFQENGVIHKYGNGQLYLNTGEAGMLVGGNGMIVRPSGMVRLRNGLEAPVNCSNSFSTQISMVLDKTIDHLTCWGAFPMKITLPYQPALGHTIRIHSLEGTGAVTIYPNNGTHILVEGSVATFYTIPGGGYSVVLTYDGGPWLGYRVGNL